jgi:hypothetical protein
VVQVLLCGSANPRSHLERRSRRMLSNSADASWRPASTASKRFVNNASVVSTKSSTSILVGYHLRYRSATFAECALGRPCSSHRATEAQAIFALAHRSRRRGSNASLRVTHRAHRRSCRPSTSATGQGTAEGPVDRPALTVGKLLELREVFLRDLRSILTAMCICGGIAQGAPESPATIDGSKF